MTDLVVEYLDIAAFIPYVRNMNTHSDEHVAEIAASIKEFGWTIPVLVDQSNTIVAGHGRILAARKLGIDRVPVIRCDNWTDAQIKAYRIADNRLPKNATVDTKMLAIELLDLKINEFDLSLLGFDDEELESLLNPEVEPAEGLTDPDAVPENVETRCKPGDLWILGEHRLLCGDSTDVTLIDRLVAEVKVDLVFTDPPYGIDEETNRVEHVKTFKNQGVAKKGNYQKIAGDKTIDTAVAVFNLIAAMNIPTVVYWGGNYYANSLPNSPCWIVWDKRVDDNQRDLNSDCELAWVKHKHKASVRIFRHLWKGMIKASEHGQARVHPTQKPVALAEWCFEQLDPKGKVVLDLFLGSGSTLIACEKTKRKCYACEIDPKYCDVILTRWEQFTGRTSVLEPADG